MHRYSALLVVLLATSLFAQPFPEGTPLINWDDVGPWMGFGPENYAIPAFEFAIEQVEGGKVSTFRKQTWLLSCFGESNDDTDCKLERLVIDQGVQLFPTGDERPPFPVMTIHKHSSADGSLRNLKVDWRAGRLDFDVVYPDGTATVIGLRFQWRDQSMYLTSFRGAAAIRGVLSNEVAAVEYRVPLYSSVLQVPISMTGYNSPEEREWDEMISTLPALDQVRWKGIRNDPTDRPTLDTPEATDAYRQSLIESLPEAAEEIRQGLDELPDGIDEQRVFLAVDRAIVSVFKVWLRRSGLSPIAQREIENYLDARLRPGNAMMSLLSF